MEIIGTNLSQEEQKSKKTMKMIAIILVILLIISIILGFTIFYLKEQQFKFTVDGKRISQIQNDLFIYEGDNIYVSIKDIADIIGYKYRNGGYKEYSEDTNKCYLENENEVCTFENNSNKIYKTPIKEVDYEYFETKTPIKKINGKLYATAETIKTACNLAFEHNKEENMVTIYTLNYLANYYTTNYKYSAVSTNFKNQKALLYGLMVVQDVDNTDTTKINSKDTKYGIYSTSGKEIVGTKYTQIEFIESTQEFIVKTTENKVGIITADGETKVRPQYDELKQIDKDLNLYLATNNNKRGVIEKNGKILIYLEYDQIGVDRTQFPTNNIKNPYLLYNNAIPVKQNGKWGMYDKKGNLILPLEYDGIGCIAGSSTDKTLNNILVIPDIKGIVFSKTYETEKNKKLTLYGIVNSLGKEIVTTALETVYSVTNNGRDEYTMINNGKSYNIIEYVNKYVDLEKLNEEDKNNTTTNEIMSNQISNVISNEMSNVIANQI